MRGFAIKQRKGECQELEGCLDGSKDVATSKQTASPLPPPCHLIFLRLAVFTCHTGLTSPPASTSISSFAHPIFVLDSILYLNDPHHIIFQLHIVLTFRLSDQNLGLSVNLPLHHCASQGRTSWRKSNFVSRPGTALPPVQCWPPGCGQD